MDDNELPVPQQPVAADSGEIEGAGEDTPATEESVSDGAVDVDPGGGSVARLNRMLLWALVAVSVVVLGVTGFLAWTVFMTPDVPRSALEQDLFRTRGLVELSPDDPNARVEYASALYRAGDVQAAVRELEAALEIQPGHGGALYNLAVVHWYNGERDKAIEDLRTLVQKHPADQAAWFRLGAFLEDRQDWKGAGEAFQRAVELRPEDAPARVRFGRALAKLDKVEEARAQYEAALQYVPDYKPALEGLDALGR